MRTSWSPTEGRGRSRMPRSGRCKTNGVLPVARAAFEHGIDTVFYIHIDAGALRRLWELFGREGSKNLVVTGHMASDSIGINALVRELRARGLRIDTYSGIVDV